MISALALPRIRYFLSAVITAISPVLNLYTIKLNKNKNIYHFVNKKEFRNL